MVKDDTLSASTLIHDYTRLYRVVLIHAKACPLQYFQPLSSPFFYLSDIMLRTPLKYASGSSFSSSSRVSHLKLV